MEGMETMVSEPGPAVVVPLTSAGEEEEGETGTVREGATNSASQAVVPPTPAISVSTGMIRGA